MSKLLRVLLVLLALPAFANEAHRVIDLKTTGRDRSSLTLAGSLGNVVFAFTESSLWRSDGTESGTFRLVENLTPAQIDAENFVSGERGVYWTGADTTVWVSDGTMAGTHSLAPEIRNARPVGEIGDAVFIESGEQLWRIDGTSRTLIVDALHRLLPRWTNATRVNDALFIATDEGLWRVDARDATHIASSAARLPTQAGDHVFFVAGSPETGAEIWITDANGAIGRPLRDIRRGPDSSFDETSRMIGLGDRLLFIDRFGNLGLLASDGKLQFLQLGSGARTNMVVVDGKAFFVWAGKGRSVTQLSVSDGTVAGTRAVRASGPPTFSPLAVNGSRVYYLDVLRGGSELFVSDGEEDGTRPVQNVRPASDIAISDGQTIRAAGDRIFFAAHDRALHEYDPFDLWVSDGTDAGTHRVASLLHDPPGPLDPGLSSLPQSFFAGTDHLYFVARDNQRWSIWRTDGTAAGTQAIIDRNSWEPVGVRGDDLVVQSCTYSCGYPLQYRLWSEASGLGPLPPRYDARGDDMQLAGRRWWLGGQTLFVIDETCRCVRSVAVTPAARSAAVFRGSFYLFDKTLRRFALGDATPTFVAALTHTEQSPFVVATAAADGALFFVLRFPGGDELWRTDGTTAGTRMLASRYGNRTKALFATGSRVVLVHGDELWGSDGTAEGTKFLATTSAYVGAEGLVWFEVRDGTRNLIWRTDGSVKGTDPDAYVNEAPDRITELFYVRGALYFAASSVPEGRELWSYVVPGPPAVTVDDVHAPEADYRVAFPVRLSHAWTKPVTVDYETVDDLAHAGTDYVAARGTLTFEPGETMKSVIVRTFGNVAEGSRSLLLRLTNTNARLARGEGVAIVDDDDAVADVSLTPRFARNGVSVVVRNAGPSVATGLLLTLPDADARTLNPLRAGEEIVVTVPDQNAISVAALERDPNPANNVVRYAAGWDSYALPSPVRPGETGTLTVVRDNQGPAASFRLESSDPDVVSVRGTAGFADGSETATVPFRAHKEGLATISISTSSGPKKDIRIRVSATLRVGARLTAELSTLCFGCANEIVVKMHGLSLDGRPPSGSVALRVDGLAAGSATIDATGTARIVASELLPGEHRLAFAYSGDDRFVDSVTEEAKSILKVAPRLGALRVNASKVLLTVRGVEGHVPSGKMNGLPLAPMNSNTSFVELHDVPIDARTITVDYSGDENYGRYPSTIAIDDVRGRAMH